eukprot:10581525-Heterocapsa_arctica.AAC.1
MSRIRFDLVLLGAPRRMVPSRIVPGGGHFEIPQLGTPRYPPSTALSAGRTAGSVWVGHLVVAVPPRHHTRRRRRCRTPGPPTPSRRRRQG